MTDIAALDRLIEAVEAWEDGGAKWMEAALGRTNGPLGMSAYLGSLDAAKALHEALLPGWGWSKPANPWKRHSVSVTGSKWQAADDDDEDAGGFPVHEGEVEGNPARAWLLAILRAHRAKIGGQ